MSILPWGLLIWFGPGLIAGLGLLCLAVWDRRQRKKSSPLSQSEGYTDGDIGPLVQRRAAAESVLLEEAQRCRSAATGLADRPDGAFLLRMATTLEQLDEERRASPSRMHHAPATAPD
jgi:hypothetical protein